MEPYELLSNISVGLGHIDLYFPMLYDLIKADILGKRSNIFPRLKKPVNWSQNAVLIERPAGLRQPTAVVCLSKLSVSTCGDLSALPGTTARGGPRD